MLSFEGKNLVVGWLKVYGSLDYAGGTAVHIASGISGLLAAIVLGKRHDYGRVILPALSFGNSCFV